jgi:hypothetical protein
MAGGAIAWSSKKQAVLALSSIESEYIGLSLAAKKAVWQRRLVGGIGIAQIHNGEPITILAEIMEASNWRRTIRPEDETY